MTCPKSRSEQMVVQDSSPWHRASPPALFVRLFTGCLSHYRESTALTPHRSRHLRAPTPSPEPKHRASAVELSVAEWGLTKEQSRRSAESPARRLSWNTTNTQASETSPQHHPTRPVVASYLSVEGLVTLADLLPLPVAPRSDELQYGLLVTAWKTGGHR